MRILYSFRFWLQTRSGLRSTSKGEQEVINYLDKRHIKYKREKRIFCNLPGQFNVYVDFYLPKQKVFIEYNGQQHYKPVAKFGGKLAFERQQIRDEWLRNYCKKEGIKLIEIPYYQNVETFLNFYLFTN